MNKTIQSREELYLQFTDDEISELGLSPGQQFSVEVDNDGIKLVPFTKLEINLDELSKKALMHLVQSSCDYNISVNEVIADMLTNFTESLQGEAGSVDGLPSEVDSVEGGVVNGEPLGREEFYGKSFNGDGGCERTYNEIPDDQDESYNENDFQEEYHYLLEKGLLFECYPSASGDYDLDFQHYLYSIRFGAKSPVDFKSWLRFDEGIEE